MSNDILFIFQQLICGGNFIKFSLTGEIPSEVEYFAFAFAERQDNTVGFEVDDFPECVAAELCRV
jgi:hypothetical protein